MFRAYRGDIGFIYDHLSKSKTFLRRRQRIDFGVGNGVHAGVDLNANYSITQAGAWTNENNLLRTIGFQHDNGLYQAAYFRNPGEKSINTNDFYNAIGGDDVVTATIFQSGSSSPDIYTTNALTRYSGKQVTGSITLDPSASLRNLRDKRSEVISYLTAQEASQVGLDKYIYHYAVDQFALHYCQNDAPEDAAGAGTGLMGYYFKNQGLSGPPAVTKLGPLCLYQLQQRRPDAQFPKR